FPFHRFDQLETTHTRQRDIEDGNIRWTCSHCFKSGGCRRRFTACDKIWFCINEGSKIVTKERMVIHNKNAPPMVLGRGFTLALYFSRIVLKPSHRCKIGTAITQSVHAATVNGSDRLLIWKRR